MRKEEMVGKIFVIAFVLVIIASILPLDGFAFQSQAPAQEAKTWYVDDDKQDYPDADFTKIQEAVDAASSGDTIFVYNGTYPEHLSISKNNLTLTAEDKDNTIIDGGYKDNYPLVAPFENYETFNAWAYDKDSSDHIEINELLNAINDYISSKISIGRLLEVINLYISYTPKP